MVLDYDFEKIDVQIYGKWGIYELNDYIGRKINIKNIREDAWKLQRYEKSTELVLIIVVPQQWREANILEEFFF